MMPSVNSKAQRLDARLHNVAASATTTPTTQSASPGLLVTWVIFAVLLLAGCGQKGPLYRPAPAPATMEQTA